MEQTRQQTLPVSPRKRPKTMKNDTRQPFLAPFRADRATAVLGIVVRMTADDLRQKAEAAARGMSVNVWSAFLAETRFRAKIATWVARFGRDLPSHHVVDGRRFFLALTGLGAIESGFCSLIRGLSSRQVLYMVTQVVLRDLDSKSKIRDSTIDVFLAKARCFFAGAISRK